MADYSDSRPTTGGQFPSNAVDAQEWLRVEPLLTPAQLKFRFLFGIPLVSFFPHPVTGKREEMSDEMIKDFIERAISQTETETNLFLKPIQFTERIPYDMNFWRSHAYVKVKKKPVLSVERWTFKASNGAELMVINNSWIDMGQAHNGQLNLVPIMPAIGANGIPATVPTPNGAAFLSLFSTGQWWVPDLIEIQYTAGFQNGLLPSIVNEIVGCVAAIEILSSLASTYRTGSYSMSIDGQSQSQSTQGPQHFLPRIEQLTQKKKDLEDRVKELFGLNVVLGWL